jgi:YebC/PmpR family DNA-binding regulatory protein
LNSTLALAIEKAKQYNMPATNIQRAISRASDKDSASLEEIVYEGIGPGGIGIFIETATDNRNRTLPEVKNVLAKNGGRIADSGSVMFQFDLKGVIEVGETSEDALLQVLEAGAEDANVEDGLMIVYTEHKDLARVRQGILNAGLSVKSAELQYVPKTTIEVSDKEMAGKLVRLFEALDDLSDIVAIHSNADIIVDLE